ncbi:MAG: HEAT repeat domain-containing protein [Paludibacteraceae bacterium]|nr:HEAT repeat domain-containing protein [Paludibacteraceae bacterium]
MTPTSTPNNSSEKTLYSKLTALTKDKTVWQESIPYIVELLENQSPKITAKALWLLGEMGLQYPETIAPYVGKIASFMDAPNDLFRERALNALGRIGRARFELVQPYWKKMFSLATDGIPQVRLSFIWASENIATNTPDPYEAYMPLFANLLDDSNDKVRMEAPEMFRVMGKRRPQMVKPYLDRLQWMAENDANPIVRIHSAGAIRVIRQE